jgi:hypothetical protein
MTFGELKDAERHWLTKHSKRGKIRCMYCQKEFQPRRDNVKRHVRQKHPYEYAMGYGKEFTMSPPNVGGYG